MKKRNAGIILSYIHTFLNMVCGLFLSSYLLKMTSKTNYGIYQTVSSFVNYLVLLEFGTGSVMTRNLSMCRANGASKDEIQKNVSTIWSITNALSITITLVAIGFYFSFAGIYKESLTAEQIIYGKQVFIFVTIHLLSSFLSSTLNGLAMGFEEYTLNAKISLLRIISRTALLVALVASFRQSIIIAMVDAGLGILISIFLYIYCRKKFKLKFPIFQLDKIVFKTALPLCLAIFLQSIVSQANSNVPKFVIGVMINPEMVTLYSVALYIYSLFSSLTTLPISMYAPQVVKDVTNGMEGKPLLDKMIQPSRFIVLLGGSILFGFIAIGQPFISIMYGDDMMLAWIIAIIIMLPMFFNMTTGILINVLDALNKRMARSVILFVTTALNIGGTILLIYLLGDTWGVVGAAVSTGVCTLLGQVILMNIYYVKALKIDVWYMYKNAFKGILLYQIIACVLAYIVAFFISNMYIAFLLGGFVYVVVAFGLFLLFGANAQEKKLIFGVFEKMKGKKNDTHQE